MGTILKYEGINLLRNRISIAAIALLVVAGLYAIYYGKTEITRQNSTITAVLEAEKIKFEKAKSAFKEPNWSVSWRTGRTVVQSPAPLSALSIGQRDVFPYYKEVRPHSLYGGIFSNELANPQKLLTGNFDLSFVFIFLLPLLIVALSYNVLSGEREQGTLSLILSNEISIRRLVFTKLLFRFSVVLATVLSLFFIGLVWTKTPFNTSAIAWLSMVCVYILFWFAVSFWIIGLQKSSAFNALSLLGSWLLVVLIVPALLNLYIGTACPMSNISDMQTEMREMGNKGWEMKPADAIGQYFALFPKNRVDTTPENSELVFDVAVVTLMDKQTQPLFDGYRQALKRKIAVSNALSWLSPAAQTQMSLNDLAHSDTDDYLSFLNNMETYYGQLKGFFDGERLGNRIFEKTIYDKMPTVSAPIQPQKMMDFWSLIKVLLLALPFFIMGFMGLKCVRNA